MEGDPPGSRAGLAAEETADAKRDPIPPVRRGRAVMVRREDDESNDAVRREPALTQRLAA